MAKAYSYIRFSTPEQIKGDSLRRQAEASEAYAHQKGLELDRTLNLRDLGFSAYDGSNVTKGALGQFLEIVRRGGIESGSYLIVENLDRLSRGQVMDALEIFLSIINAGITIVTLMDMKEYSKDSLNQSPTELIISILTMSRAAEESQTKSMRIKASWDNKRNLIHEKRLTARCPYWLRPSSTSNGFEFIPERVEVVRRIISMANNGLGNSLITKILNQEGVKPFSNKTDGWQPTYIQKLLKNPALYGDINLYQQRDDQLPNQNKTISGYYPAIISKPEWLQLDQNRVARTDRGGNNKGKYISNLLSGLLICGHCGGSMTMLTSTKKLANGETRIIKQLGCSRARRGLGCRHMAWNYQEFEQELLSFCTTVNFSELTTDTTNTQRNLKNLNDIKFRLEDELKQTDMKINNLLTIMENNGLANTLESITQRLHELEEEKRGLNSSIAENEQKINKSQVQVLEQSNQQEIISSILQKLESLADNDLHIMRATLASILKRSIASVHLYPGGPWLNPMKMQTLENNLLLTGESEENIQNYIKNLSEPIRSKKYFVVIFHNGKFIRVTDSETMENYKSDRVIKYTPRN